MRKRHHYTEEHVKFLKDHAAKMSRIELTALFNREFQLSMNVEAIRAFCRNHKLPDAPQAKFQKGRIPWNKGTKGLVHGGSATQFKKGCIAHNRLPVGYERKTWNGYTLVKIDEKNWVRKHIYLWEQHNGPIPNDSCLIFLDGNKENVTLENLELVKRSELALINRYGLKYQDAEATSTGILIAKTLDKAYQRMRESQ